MSHRSAGTFATPGLYPAPRLREAILGSWQRCRAAGLDMETRPDASLLTQAELAARQEAGGAMLRSARPLLQSLYAQVAAAGQVAVLCDAEGMILASLGDPAFLRDAERLALKPGACWSEVARGTNAIGTGIALGAAVRVHGDEHFIRRHHRLSCSAAPFRYADGSLAGLIDVSGPPERAPDDLLQRVSQTSAILEQQLFLAAWPGASIVALHTDPARLGLPDAQLLAVDGDGAILGVSHPGALHGATVEQALRQWRQEGVGRLLDSLQRGRTPQRLPEAKVHAHLLRPALKRGTGSSSVPHGAVATMPMPETAGERDVQPNHARLPVQSGADRITDRSTDRTPDRTSHIDAASPLPGISPRLIDTARRLLSADIPVLLQGETGTGKDVLARWLHEHGPLAARPFVAINCAAIPESLIEAELFGYEEGAFTGARRKGMPGRLVEADGGILFLDEIGDMPLAMQTRLLRVLQDRMVHPLGGGRARQANFRLICATHRDLPALVAAGSFREDLFYRINHYPLTLPPLRERPGLADIVDAVAERHHAGARGIALAPDLRTALQGYDWPGNLRQLDNLLATLLALCDDGGTIALEDLPPALFEQMGRGCDTLAVETDDEVQDTAPSCADLIRRHGGASAAARAMGLSRSTFYRRLRAQRGGNNPSSGR